MGSWSIVGALQRQIQKWLLSCSGGVSSIDLWGFHVWSENWKWEWRASRAVQVVLRGRLSHQSPLSPMELCVEQSTAYIFTYFSGNIAVYLWKEEHLVQPYLPSHLVCIALHCFPAMPLVMGYKTCLVKSVDSSATSLFIFSKLDKGCSYL